MSKISITKAKNIIRQRGIIHLLIRLTAYLSRKDAHQIERMLKYRKINKIQEHKQSIEGKYNHNPKVSLLIQSFNNRENIDDIVNCLPEEDIYEIIVLEDGSIDGSLEKWDKHLDRRNDFLIRSNDLHEIRTYERGVNMSQGKYICLLQDDDQYPDTYKWICDGMRLFDSFPNLGAVGGWGPNGLGCVFDSAHNQLSRSGKVPPISEWEYTSNELVFPRANNEDINTVDPNTNIPIIFVPWVAVGPIIIDREALNKVGGFNFDFSEPGEPGIKFDTDLGLRLWKNGYKVGYSNMGFYQNNTTGGTMLYNPESRHKNNVKNRELCREEHQEDFEHVEKLICDANQGLVNVEQKKANSLIDTT